jgi:hypothetical protein
MPLTNLSLLIVDPRRSMLVHEVRWSVEAEGGACVIAPDVATATKQCRRFAFTAAAVHVSHSAWALNLGVPHVVYGETDAASDVLAMLGSLLRA